tara:strand:- start:148 stop:489 length:342 start_codon:yes stop_codon:yes gene_type:complete
MASDNEINEIAEIKEELASAKIEIASLKIKATTTLTGNEFITIILIGPVIAAFVILGIIIVWKTTSNPDLVAPHLDIILVAFAIFSNPVSGALGAVVGKFADEKSSRKKENET